MAELTLAEQIAKKREEELATIEQAIADKLVDRQTLRDGLVKVSAELKELRIARTNTCRALGIPSKPAPGKAAAEAETPTSEAEGQEPEPA